MKKLLAQLLFLGVLLMNACQKESSFENGNIPSQGLLQSDVTGDCFPKTVAGTYVQGTSLNGTSNFITISVMVTTPGSYTIGSDTVNGVFFRLTGIFTATGMETVNLRGNGTPAGQGTYNFRIQYDSQECVVPVTFLPTGAGGPAVFTLNGAGGNCTGANVAGSYAAGVALNSTNKVTINVTVTTIGSYNISTTVTNGMTFSAAGTFAATGPQTIVLSGAGTPTAAGSNTIPITVGSTSCSFPVTVGSAAVFSVNCSSAVINGDYEEGIALDLTNTVGITVNATTPGVYSISASANGMTFSGSGTLTAGANSITLTGSGIPAADGSFNFNMPGTPGCSFAVVVNAATSDPPATGTWKFTEGTVTYQGTISFANFDNTSAPPFSIFYFYGLSSAGEIFEIDLADLGGGILAAETYNMANATGTANAAGFYFDGVPPKTYEADPTVTGNTMIATVTSHNTATKTITGTFSGNAKDNNGAFKAITNGSFSVTYQ